MRKRWLIYALLAVVAACLLSLLVYNLPPVHSRLAWRVDSAQAQIYYYFNPPQDVVFIPQEQQIEAIVQATLQALPTLTMSAHRLHRSLRQPRQEHRPHPRHRPPPL